jgi:hypothetical protein
MPFLVVGGITVPVAADGGVGHEVEEIGGEVTRAFDGTAQIARRGVKHRYSVSTAPLSRTAADALRTVLVGAQPVTCSGDLPGASGSYITQVRGYRPVPVAGGDTRYSVEFSLIQV